MLNDRERSSPIDPPDDESGRGKWYDERLAAVAEEFYRRTLGRPAPKQHPRASSEDAVRITWRDIPAQQLTAAERALAEPEIARMAGAARRHVAAAIKRSNAAFREHYRGTPPAREIPAPPLYAPQLEEPPPNPGEWAEALD